MPIWMIGGWIVPGALYCCIMQRFLCHAIMSIAIEPNGCGRSTLVKNRNRGLPQVPIPEGNWHPVAVEVVAWSLDLFRRESNMPLWMIGGWIVPGGLSCGHAVCRSHVY